jgi:hypothetical protein
MTFIVQIFTDDDLSPDYVTNRLNPKGYAGIQNDLEQKSICMDIVALVTATILLYVH